VPYIKYSYHHRARTLKNKLRVPYARIGLGLPFGHQMVRAIHVVVAAFRIKEVSVVQDTFHRYLEDTR